MSPAIIPEQWNTQPFINSIGIGVLQGFAEQMILQKRSKRSAYTKIKVDEPFVYMVYGVNSAGSSILYAGVFH
ncbi:hypothetical protein M3Y96_00237900 [Aphelenchoides besseyi]|nr:hypothetical protein M3Y96_00237900 [Aphelenchoides besseyi]